MEETQFPPIFPIGYRFVPTDGELVCHYLYRRIATGDLYNFENSSVKYFDLYGPYEPNEIWDRFGGRNLVPGVDLFFFTKLKKKSAKGKRIDRGIGHGTWHGENTDQFEVGIRKKGNLELLMVTKRRFSYRNPGSTQHKKWIMFEYSLELNDEIVVCSLRRNETVEEQNAGAKKRKSLAVSTEIAKKRKGNESVEYPMYDSIGCSESSSVYHGGSQQIMQPTQTEEESVIGAAPADTAITSSEDWSSWTDEGLLYLPGPVNHEESLQRKIVPISFIDEDNNETLSNIMHKSSTVDEREIGAATTEIAAATSLGDDGSLTTDEMLWLSVDWIDFHAGTGVGELLSESSADMSCSIDELFGESF